MREFVSVEPGRRWPSGDYESAAIIPLSETSLVYLLGAKPLYGTESGLGEWAAFGGELNSVVMELIRHHHSPGPVGFELRVDAGANAARLLGDFIKLAGLQLSELPWVSPKLAQQIGQDGLPGSSSR